MFSHLKALWRSLQSHDWKETKMRIRRSELETRKSRHISVLEMALWMLKMMLKATPRVLIVLCMLNRREVKLERVHPKLQAAKAHIRFQPACLAVA